MKLGFVTAILPEYSFTDLLKFAAREGFGSFEALSWPVGKAERKYAGITNIDVTTLTRTKAEDILAQCREHDVCMTALGYYPNALDPDKQVAAAAVTHLKKVIKTAPLLGLDLVTGFIGRDWTKTVDENWPRFLKTWRPLIKLAEDNGVRIAIENCPMLFTRDEWPGGKNLMTTPSIWRRAFSDIDSKSFGLNYDPSHFVLQGMDPLGPLAEFRAKIFHIHAKDVQIDRSALNETGRFDFPLRWHRPRIPGYGEIDWAAFMAEVQRTGYDGPFCIEVEDDTFGRTLEGRMKALRVARNVLRPFFA
ncbi:MAG: sugar phosphate isomerase/epimerase [Verrucomicrobiaceae bacterium]|nr:sugar phosphate isomerase/epimerase [Verrucomicrobiaceae bacterium]